MPQACLVKSVQILLAQMLFRITTSPKYFAEVQEKYNLQKYVKKINKMKLHICKTMFTFMQHKASSETANIYWDTKYVKDSWVRFQKQ